VSRPQPQKPVLPRPTLDSKIPAARQFYDDAMKAIAQGRFDDARWKLFTAFSLEPHYSILCNMADVEIRLGRPRDALEKMGRCVDGLEHDARATEAERAAVQKLINLGKSTLLVVVVQGPESDEPTMVTVSVDTDRTFQTFHGRTDEILYLEPGKHVLTFWAEGYQSERVELDAVAGTQKELRPALKKKAAAVPVATTPLPPPPDAMVPVFALGVAGLAAIGLLLGARWLRRALERHLTRG
jgi:hypothetical protein